MGCSRRMLSPLRLPGPQGAFPGAPGWTQRWPSPGSALEHRCLFTIFRPGHKSQGGGWEGGEKRKSVFCFFFF